MDDNFQRIKYDLHATDVLIRLADQDDYHGQYGGGWGYNPSSAPAYMKGRAIAQNIILAIAEKWGLGVIFVIELGGYHLDGVPSQTGLTPDLDLYEDPQGAWDYIHAYFDPGLYYWPSPGLPYCSVSLHVIGLPEVCTANLPFYNDPRVTGWLLEPEWHTRPSPDPLLSTQEETILYRYWDFFYGLVHWQGANTGFAGLYMISADMADYADRIPKYVQLFAQQRYKPELWGLTWFGNGTYDTANIAVDMDNMVWLMGQSGVPASSVAFMEGGTTKPDAAFYTHAIWQAVVLGTKGISVWGSDDLNNTGICTIGTEAPTNYALFDVTVTSVAIDPAVSACPDATQSPGWRQSLSQVVPEYDTFGAGYGLAYYSAAPGGLTAKGQAVADEFNAPHP